MDIKARLGGLGLGVKMKGRGEIKAVDEGEVIVLESHPHSRDDKPPLGGRRELYRRFCTRDNERGCLSVVSGICIELWLKTCQDHGAFSSCLSHRTTLLVRKEKLRMHPID